MLTRIYECTDIIADFFVCLLLARYVFLIPPLRTRRAEHLFWLAGCIVPCIISQFFGLLMGHQSMGFCLAVYIYLATEGQPHRLFNAFQFFPIMGMALALILPLNRIPPLLLQMQPQSQALYTLALYAVLAVPLNLLLFRRKAQRQKFCEDMRSRQLERWEKGFLYSIGTMMTFFTPTLTLYDFDSMTGDARLHFIHMTLMSSLVCFLVTLTVIILIISGGKSVHLKTQVLGMQHNIIAAMADIVENRDENTGGHIKRTAKYVEIIAVNLKVNQLYTNILTDQYIADMIIAAPLHDIGKIHIPDAVLKKQGRFTDEEFQIMKSHTTAGRRLLTRAEGILGKSSYLDIAVQMANYHHEWWNGRGYPEGLKGQDIPLCARIMAVADVFDSLVSKRCYKGAMSIETAYDLIRRESGTHFDPVIVDAFLDAKEEITEVLEEFAEDPYVIDEPEEPPMAGSRSPIRPEFDEDFIASHSDLAEPVIRRNDCDTFEPVKRVSV